MNPNTNTVAVFDFDNTLIAGDSMQSWGQELIRLGWVDREEFLAKEFAALDAYKAGALDIGAYAKRHFDIINAYDEAEVESALNAHFNNIISPKLYQAGIEQLQQYQAANIPVAIISASPYFMIRNVAKNLRVDYSFGSGYAYENGHYLSTMNPIQPYKEGKVACYHQWVEQLQLKPTTSYFYSDSHTDLPLLNIVTDPIIIHPDERLKAIAQDKNWPIIHW